MSHRAIRAAALALLTMDDAKGMTRRAASFCGQCVVDPTPLTEAQSRWLDQLLARNGLTPLGGDQ